MRNRLVGAALWSLLLAPLAAANFWDTKPFAMWSDKELQEVVTDSPWSRQVQVVLNVVGRGGNLAEAEGAGGGARGGDADGGGGGRGGGRGGGGRAGFPTPAPQMKLLLSWRSALPMKQALVRSQMGAGGGVSDESQALLARAEPQYLLTLSGLPLRYARALGTMQTETFLKRNGKPPIAPAEIGAQQTATDIIIVVAFPKDAAITAADKDVEFVTKVGQVEIKKKFTLKDMMFHGQLEL